MTKIPHKLNLSTSWHFSALLHNGASSSGAFKGPKDLGPFMVCQCTWGDGLPFDDQGIKESSNHRICYRFGTHLLLMPWSNGSRWSWRPPLGHRAKKNVLQMVIHVFFLGWKQRLLEKLPLSCMGLPHLISWQVIEKHRVQARGDSYRSAGQSAGTRAPKTQFDWKFLQIFIRIYTFNWKQRNQSSLVCLEIGTNTWPGRN